MVGGRGGHVPDPGGRPVRRLRLVACWRASTCAAATFRTALYVQLWAALKATGIGILVEFGMVCLAGSVWMVGVTTHFMTR